MWQCTVVDVSSYPFWKFCATSDIRKTVDVTKVQSQNTKLIRVLLKLMDVLLSALGNTKDCSLTEKARSEELQ